MKEFLDACLNANLQIRKYLNNIPQNDLKLCSKLGYDKNQGYELDLKCEQIFIKYLSCFGQIFSEESGLIGKASPKQMILDPLDGSSNFVSKIPFYGTSIALMEKIRQKVLLFAILSVKKFLLLITIKLLNPIFPIQNTHP